MIADSRVARVAARRWQGHEAVEIANEELAAIVVPGVGAKVVSLLDRRTGRELLAAPVRPIRSPGSTQPWEQGACSGWDECFPTIAPCRHPVSGAEIPDHGEAWRVAWDVAADDGTVVTAARFATVALQLERRITVHGATLRADYVARNDSDDEQPFLWAMHLLLAARPGTRLSVPPGTRWRVEYSNPSHGAAELRWPARDGSGRRLDVVAGEARGVALKLFSQTPLNRASTDAIAVAWNPPPAGRMGLWINDGGWPASAPLRHLAIEPSLGDRDDLAAAVEHGTAASLPAGGQLRWAVDLEILRRRAA